MRSFSFLSFLIIVFVSVAELSASPFGIPVTRDLSNRPLPTRAEYLEQFPETEFQVQSIDRAPVRRDEEGTVVMAINTDLYNNLEEEFNGWIADLENEDWDVVLVVTAGGTAADLKALMIEEGGEDLQGVILCGNLPLAWYEHHEHFRGEDEPDNQRIVEYPIDMFFTDIDGVWEDTTGNSIYDHHHGEVHPDIWLGRLPAHNLSRIDEYEITAQYLERLHQYRNGEIELPHRALNFIDDDWAGNDERWSDAMQQAYGFVFCESDSNETSGQNYQRTLGNEAYEMVQVAVHSTSDSHSFMINDHNDRDYFRFFHLRDDVDPQAMFYNLFACSNMNFAENHNLCMGVLYAMGPDYGLGSVGSTKTGGMLFFNDYYTPLGEGENFGESLRSWMVIHAHDPESPNWSRSWFYGMTHYGDPTLKIPMGLRVAQTIFHDTEGDDDGILDAGETTAMSLDIINRRHTDFENIEITLSTGDDNVSISRHEGQLNSVPAESNEISDGYEISVAEELPDGYTARINVEMNPADEQPWMDMLKLPVRAPRLEIVGFDWEETEEGNEDGILNPGEDGRLFIRFRNSGGDEMNVEGVYRIRPLDEQLLIENDSSIIPVLQPDSSDFTQSLEMSVAGDNPESDVLFFEVQASVNDIDRGSGMCALPLTADFRFDADLNTEPVWINHYSLSERYMDAWQWQENAGEESGGIAVGGPDTLEYPPRCDSALELPLMMYDEDAVLIIKHRMDMETMYDGAVIEVDRGQGWHRVEPEDGYPGQSVEIGTFEGGACWNGTFDWQTDRVPLGSPAGALRVRLRFASDAGVQGNGWFIDDLAIEGNIVSVENQASIPQGFDLVSVYPNPFNSTLNVAFNLYRSTNLQIGLFDLNGRLVKTLASENAAAGSWHRTFNLPGLASNVYILGIDASGKTYIQKVLLLK